MNSEPVINHNSTQARNVYRNIMSNSFFLLIDISYKRLTILLLIFISLYFPMMSSIPLSIDSETTILNDSHFYWIGQGRWGAYIVTLLFPPHLVPYFTLAIFGLLTTLGYIFLLSACRLPSDWKTGAGFAVFSSFPIWSYILEFSPNVVQVGVGVLCCCISLWLLVLRVADKSLIDLHVAEKSIIAGIEITITAFAISLYQAFVFVYPALVLAHLLIIRSTTLHSIRLLLNAYGILLTACVVYYLIGKGFSVALGVEPEYVGEFLRFDAVVGDPIGTLTRTFGMARDAYLGARSLYGTPLYAAAAVSVLFVCVIGIRSNLWEAFLAVCLLAVPFGFIFTAGGFRFPPRALLAIPVAIWAMTIVLLHAPSRLARAMGNIAVGLLIFQSAAAISTYQAVRELRSEFDRRVASQIYTGIAALADGKKQKVEFYGGVDAPQPLYGVGLHSTAAGSFFSWDGGNPERIMSYMRLLGYQDLETLSAPEREALTPEFQGMPAWPRPGYIRRHHDIILVKLGQIPGLY